MMEQIAPTPDQVAQAIIDLINSQPRSPTKDELAAIIGKVTLPAPGASVPMLRAEWDALAAEIRAAMARKTAAETACGKLHAGPEFDRAEALAHKRCDELRALVDRLPSPPRTFGDLAFMAEIAAHYAVRHANGRMHALELDNGDMFDLSAARLIEAVLQLAEARHAAVAAPAAPPTLSSEHLAYRKIVAEIERCNNDPDMPDEETDAALSRIQEQASELEAATWAKPAKTLADVLLRAEIALLNENGVMDSLNNPDAYYDDRANAELIRAVLDVLGGPHAL